MKRKKWLSVVGVMVLALVLVMGLVVLPLPVESAGTTEVKLTAGWHGADGKFDLASGQTWEVCYDGTGPERFVNGCGSQVGFGCSPTYDNYVIYEGVFGVDISSIPEDAEIVSIKIRVYTFSKNDDGGQSGLYYAVYKADPQTNQTNGGLASEDMYKWKNPVVRASHIIDHNSIEVGAWTTFEVMDSKLDTFFDFRKQFNQIQILSTYLAMNVKPTYISGWKYWYVLFESYEMVGGKPAELIVTYLGEAPEREVIVDDNEPIDPDPDPSAELDAIDWVSPRANYRDEYMAVIATGDSGAEIELNLVNDDGRIIATIQDSIRTDGEFKWKIKVGSNKAEFIRVIDTKTQICCDWGYTSSAPSSEQPTNSIMVMDAIYPHWFRPVGDFVVKANDVVEVHWKTNMVASENPDYSVQIYRNGQSGDVIYNQTIEWLGTNYYYNTSDNDGLLGWRYMLFSPLGSGDGFNSYDGMVVPLSLEFGGSNDGHYQPLIKQTTGGSDELTETHSSFWYVDRAVDVGSLIVASGVWGVGKEYNVNMVVGERGKIATYLSDGTVRIIDAQGKQINIKGGVLTTGNNNFEIQSAGGEGTHFVEFGATKEDVSWTLRIRQKIEVSGEGAGGGLLPFVIPWGLDNPAGRWIIILCGMAVAFIFTYKRSRLLSVVAPLMVLGIGIVMGWVDTWIIVLLSLGAGVVIYGMIKRRTQGGASE